MSDFSETASDIWNSMARGEFFASISDTAMLANRHSEMVGVADWHCFLLWRGKLNVVGLLFRGFSSLPLLLHRMGLYSERLFLVCRSSPSSVLSTSDASTARILSRSSSSCSFQMSFRREGAVSHPALGGSRLLLPHTVAARGIGEGISPGSLRDLRHVDLGRAVRVGDSIFLFGGIFRDLLFPTRRGQHDEAGFVSHFYFKWEGVG